MSIQTLKLNPGVDVEQTPILLEAGWASAQLVRSKQGLVEKYGGWQHLNANPIIGTARGIHAWADLLSNPYVGIGTEQRLQLFSGGMLYDITPIRKTSNITPAFSTTISTSTVKITDTANGVAVGDWVFVSVPIAVGGLIVQGFYQVQTVVDANNYTITVAPATATSTVTAGGAVPAFTTTATSPNISVFLTKHGLSVNSSFQVQVTTTVGGITMAGGTTYVVNSVTDANHFVIAPGTIAASNATVSENSGNAQIEYLIPTGATSTMLTSGYGIGLYGQGLYGVGSTSSAYNYLRQWFLDNWGQDLIGNYTGSPVYVWTPPLAYGNPALAINTTNYPSATDPPAAVNVSFVAVPQQQLIALGCSLVGGGSQDPNLVRFSDVANFTAFTPTATNQAGSYRIPTGSRLVGGTSNGTYCVLWTDIDVWLMNYLGFPLVWGFNKIASGVGLLNSRAFGNYKSNVYWVTASQFMMFDGSTVQILPCPVWDYFFYNLNTQQAGKVFCGVNSEFGEIGWYFPSTSGTGECDTYVIYAAAESQRLGAPIWYTGKLPRTCWTDVNVYGPPLATDTSSNLQQHEVGWDADGSPMVATVTSGYMALADGAQFQSIRRLIPDMTLTGGTAPNNSVYFTLSLLDYPTDTPQVVGPFEWTPSTPEFILTMCRGRLVSISISSNALGVFWRLGAVRIEGAPAGAR